jgi:putative ABC transport system permease protein
MWLVTAQAAFLGIAGSLSGVVLGVVLAMLLTDALRSAGSVPLDRPVFEPSLVGGSVALGLLVTLVAAVEPALRAARMSPIEALRARGRPGRSGRARLSWLIAILGVVAIAGSLAFPAGAGPMGAGRSLVVYGLLLGAVLVAPPLLAPLGRLAGVPFAALLRLEERLARAALIRDRGRTGLTLGALVVGLTMVVALGAVASNARMVASAWIRDVVPGDEVLTALAPVPLDDLSPEPDLEAVDGVAGASPIATFDLAVRGRRVPAAAIIGADFDRDARLAFVAGDRGSAFARLDSGGTMIVPRAQAERLGLALGDPVAVPMVDGTLAAFTVVGIVERSLPSDGGEAVLIGWTDATERFGVAGADAFAVRYASGAPAGVREQVAALAAERALTVTSIEGIAGAVTAALDRLFGLFDVLALAAVIVAALGIVNTMSMDVWERVREIGVLRAAGMSRRQVWRMVLVEAGILGAIGALIGSLTGVVVGAVLVIAAGGGFELPLTPSWPTIGLAVLLGVGLSMLAASQPARLASRLSIVRAVRAE